MRCCREELGADGEAGCSWLDHPLDDNPLVIDDACSYGFSRTYAGSNCVGDPALDPPLDTACECTGGTCAKCGHANSNPSPNPNPNHNPNPNPDPEPDPNPDPNKLRPLLLSLPLTLALTLTLALALTLNPNPNPNPATPYR